MTEPMTDDRLAEIRERAEKATPGPYEPLYDRCECEYPCGHKRYTYALKLPVAHTERESEPHYYDFHYSEVADFSAETLEFFIAAREDVPALLAEVERLRAERNNAVATVAEQAQRLTAREQEHNADRAALARTRAMLTDARDRCDEAEAKLHQVATAPVHTAADGREFVLISDLAAVLLPPAPADDPTPEQARIRAALREAGEAIYGGCDCPTPCTCAADAATLTAQLAEEAGDLDG